MQNIIDYKLVSVIRTNNLKEALHKAEACIEGGICLVELTYSFPDTPKAIKILSNNKDIKVGAGTIINIDQAVSAIESGAQFLVSPHTDKTLIEYAAKHKIVSISGASTSNEIVNAHKMGADLVKIFPANLIGGPDYIRAMMEPLPFIKTFVTGGINKSNICEYLKAGVSLVGVSSALFHGTNYNEKNTIGERTKELIKLVKSIDKQQLN